MPSQRCLLRFLDGELVYKIEAGALNLSGAIIPEEPM